MTYDLIQLCKRVREREKEYLSVNHEYEIVCEQNKQLKETLQQYANPSNWKQDESGKLRVFDKPEDGFVLAQKTLK